MYEFEDMVSFALTVSSKDSLYVQNVMPKEVESLQRSKAWESTYIIAQGKEG
jgi:hypothetical protein